MLKRILSIATVLTFLATPASAQSALAPTTSAVDFGGAYVGADLNALNFDNTSVDTKTKFDFGYAGRAGYGVQTAQGWYYGAEASDGTNSGVTRSTSAKSSIGNDFAADVRGGKVVQDTLLYGKVGYALTSVTAENLGDGTSNTSSFSGVRLGAGAEHYVTDKITGRAEAVYTDYQSRTLDSVNVDPSNVAVKIGVSYKLD